MFDSLSQKLGSFFSALGYKGTLSNADIDGALKEIRSVLLEADVSVSVVKDFVERAREHARGRKIVKSVSPAQLMIKVVNDTLVELLGEDHQGLKLDFAPPVVIMMVGLQGSGKTTTSAKLAYRLEKQDKRKVLLASLDIYRPAAQQQLETLAHDNGLSSLEIVEKQKPLAIANRALKEAKISGFDTVILDTAGRLHTDAQLINELVEIKNNIKPNEILLVADSVTGQDAVNIAQVFDEKVGINGIILSRVDGDARGGAALSMRWVTGKPIKMLGNGEKIADLEGFYPDRIANRILGMGDVVSLVDKALLAENKVASERTQKKLKKGKFDFEDLQTQLLQMNKMGGISALLNYLPGAAKLKGKSIPGLDDKVVGRQLAIISSMTVQERRNPKLLAAKRKKRIAKGAGVDVRDVNVLVKMQRQMADLVKKSAKGSGKGMPFEQNSKLTEQIPNLDSLTNKDTSLEVSSLFKSKVNNLLDFSNRSTKK